MLRMAQHYKMTFDQTETFIDIIVAMDDEVLNASSKYDESKSGEVNPPKK